MEDLETAVTSTAVRSSECPLLALPLDIHLSITDVLDARSILWLSLTCRLLHRTLAPTSRSQTFSLLVLEWLAKNSTFHHKTSQHEEEHDSTALYACFRCHRLKPRSAFSLKQTTRARGRGPAHSQAEKRFCLDCGVKHAIYANGNQITKLDGTVLGICLGCGQYMDGSEPTACSSCRERGEVLEGGEWPVYVYPLGD